MKAKKPRGRPIGGKAPAEVRKYWRVLQSNYRAKMNSAANKEIKKARKVP